MQFRPTAERVGLLHEPLVDVGETCVVAGGGCAVMYTGRPTFWCCIMWGFECLEVPDGSVVEVMDVEPTNHMIVTVRVLRSSELDLENLIGTMKAVWLRREQREEALADGMSADYYAAFASPDYDEPAARRTLVTAPGSTIEAYEDRGGPGGQVDRIRRALGFSGDADGDLLSSSGEDEDEDDDEGDEEGDEEEEEEDDEDDEEEQEELEQQQVASDLLDEDETEESLLPKGGAAAAFVATPAAPGSARKSPALRPAATPGGGTPRTRKRGGSDADGGAKTPNGATPRRKKRTPRRRGSDVAAKRKAAAAAAAASGGVAQADTEDDGHSNVHRSEKVTSMVRAKMRLPGGMLRLEHLLKVQPLFTRGVVRYADLLPVLTATEPRMMRGDVLRALSGRITSKRFEKLSFLRTLLTSMVNMRTTGRSELTCAFSFGGSKDREVVTTPVQRKWVLLSGDQANPYAVSPRNKPLQISTEARKFVVSEKLRFRVTPKGIKGVQEGDVKYKTTVFSFNADIQSVHNVTKVELDSKNRPYLKEGADGRPLVRDGQYQPALYDDWIVISVLGSEYWIGLPHLT